MNTTKNIVDAIQDATQSKRSAYDTSATVKRIEGDTAWVHIPGGVDETPVSLTISASIGDTVQIRVGGGKAWIVGNATSPPTDDTKAKSVAKSVDELRKHNVAISGDVKRLYKGVDGINTLIRESSDGVEVGKVDSSGAYTAGHTLINASDNSYDVIDANGDTVASFGTDTQIGALDDSHITLSNAGIKMFDSSGDTVASFGEETIIGTPDEYNVHFFNDYTETDDGAGGILDKEYNGGLKVFYADGIQGRVAHKKEDIYNGSSSPEIQVTSLILQNISPNRTKGTEITMLPNQVKICAGAYNSSTERVADTRATYVDASGIDTRCVKCGGYPILTVDTVTATISTDATDQTIYTRKTGYTAIGIVGWDWSGTGTATCYMNRLSLNSSGNVVVNTYRAAGSVNATLEVNVLYISTTQGI